MRYLSLMCGALALLSALPVCAQDANAQRALQKAQFMLRQATSEKAELQTQVDALKQQVEKLTQNLTDTKATADSSKKKMQKEYGGAIDEWKQRDAKLGDELTDLQQKLAHQTEQSKKIEAQLQEQTQNFSVCYENNKKMYDINQQILARYENKGFGDVLEQKEPFTGIKQVEIENIVQDYRYKLDDLKVQPEQPVASDTDGAGKTQSN